MSTFDPIVVRTLIRNTLPEKQQKAFEADWKESVKQKVESWLKHRTATDSSRPQATAQFEWDANVVKYVDYINKLTKEGPSGSFLPNGLPLYGPRFVPPTYRDLTRHQKSPKIDPEFNYLKPLHTIHPFYFPHIAACPVCSSTVFKWEGWNSKGHRDVHGIDKEEYAIGVQLRCKGSCKDEHIRVCAENKSRKKEDRVPEPNYCFATTNMLFWQDWELWALPRGMPVFFKRCGVTPELLDLIIETRPSTTSSGLSENIRQLHLLDHGRAFLDYLQTYRDNHGPSWLDYHKLKPFASAFETEFGGSSISDEIISEVYLEFTSRSRQGESEEYMRTLHGICISMDATFKVVNKAVIVDSKRRRTTVMKGGITSTINEHTETLIWRMCQSQKNVEMTEALDGYARRCKELNVALPEITVVDSCCHFRSAILQSLPTTLVVLDVYHVSGRYLAAVVDGMKNPHRSAVARDVVDCILKARAADGKPAQYWSQPEQEQKLEEMYEKWVRKGTVWSAAAQKVHEDQLAHVRKGCLARSRQDIRTDGSRIEGTNRHWNSIMRSHPCGVELFSGLAHDFVHRRNMRIGTARVEGKSVSTAADQFLASTGGSHHVHLFDCIAKQWNTALVQIERKANAQTTLTDRPRLPIVNSGETFGLVPSDHTRAAFGGVLEAEAKKLKVAPLTKEEREQPVDLVQLAEQEDPIEVESQSNDILKSMHIDPSLRLVPQSNPASLTTMGEVHSPESENADVGMATNLRIITDLTEDSEHDHIASSQLITAHSPVPASSAALARPSSAAPAPSSSAAPAPSSSTAPAPSSSAAPAPPSSATPAPSSSAAPSQLAITHSSVPPPSGAATCTASTKRKRSDLDKPIQSDARKPTQLETNSSSQTEPQAKRLCLSSQHRVVPAVSKVTSRIVVPGSRHQVGSRVSTFFQSHKPASKASVPEPPTPATEPSASVGPIAGTSASDSEPPTQSHKEATMRPIPIPDLAGLTRTERFFSVLTGIHPHSMRIGRDEEYFLFADMRLEYKWASFAMTSSMWIDAAAEYNARLRAKNKKKGLPFVQKHPQALIDKLDVMEKAVKERIKAGDFKSHHSDNYEFWTKQCAVVAFSQPNAKPRKVQTCSRCKTVKYPGPTGAPENHKLKCCSDGVKITDDKDMPPPWPQPSGIYKDGTHFNAAAFLDTVRDYYERIVVDHQHFLDLPTDLINFALTLDARLVKNHPTEEKILFRLWQGLEIDGPPLRERILDVAGDRYLIIDPFVLVAGAGAQLGSAARSSGGALVTGAGSMQHSSAAGPSGAPPVIDPVLLDDGAGGAQLGSAAGPSGAQD